MEFISDQKRADELLDALFHYKDSRDFYFDLEADNYHHYNEILCTVQVCVNGDYFLFDAINLDLTTRFLDVLRGRKAWFHGCDYDLHLLYSNFGVIPQHLCDTQIAARLCGYRKFGYAPLVEQICNIQLPKDSQRADWTRRPLSPKMIDYAKNDVRYLPQLADVLRDQLEKLGRTAWFDESCEALKKNSRLSGSLSLDQKWRINGAGNLSSEVLRYVRGLYFWRDGEAKKLDRPPFKVVKNQMLLQWGIELSEGKKVSYFKGLNTKQRCSLDSAIQEAESLPKAEWPERAPRLYRSKVKVDEVALRAILSKRDALAKQLNIESSFIASRKTLELIVKDATVAENLLLLWQRELLEL